MNNSLDSGKIIKQFTCDINPSDNKNTLEKKLTELSINKLVEVLDYVKQDGLSFVDQDETKKTYCKKINKEDAGKVAQSHHVPEAYVASHAVQQSSRTAALRQHLGELLPQRNEDQ